MALLANSLSMAIIDMHNNSIDVHQREAGESREYEIERRLHREMAMWFYMEHQIDRFSWYHLLLSFSTPSMPSTFLKRNGNLNRFPFIDPVFIPYTQVRRGQHIYR